MDVERPSPSKLRGLKLVDTQIGSFVFLQVAKLSTNDFL